MSQNHITGSPHKFPTSPWARCCCKCKPGKSNPTVWWFSNQIPQFDDFQTKFHSLMIYNMNIGWFFRSWQSWRALPGLKMELGSKLAFFGSLWKRMLEFDNKTFSLADHEDFINSFRNSINSSIGSHPLFLIKRT